MKYIDAEQLKVLLSDLKENHKYYNGDFHDGVVFTVDEIEEIIDSLQQEQQDENLEKDFSIAWAKHPIPKEFIPDLLVNRGLREFIYKTAHHFYELGRLNARKEETE